MRKQKYEKCLSGMLAFVLMCFICLYTGQYIYFETSNPTRPKDKAALASPDLGVRRACLSFYYHMFGKGVGSLKVVRSNVAGRRILWARHTNEGDRWLNAQVDIKEDSLYNVSHVVNA